MDLLSGRSASALLGAGAGVSREQARRALLAGVAGPGVRTSGAVLYERARVAAAANRVRVSLEELPASDRHHRSSTFVARLAPRREPTGDREPGSGAAWVGADATAPLDEQLAAAVGPYVMTALTHVLLDIEARAERVPLIGVVGVFVVMGAEIVAVHGSAARGSVLQLTAPGGWFDAWQGRRFPHSGGGAWCEWPPGFDRAARRIDG